MKTYNLDLGWICPQHGAWRTARYRLDGVGVDVYVYASCPVCGREDEVHQDYFWAHRDAFLPECGTDS